MSAAGSEVGSAALRAGLLGAYAQVKRLIAGSSDRAVAGRMAGGAFVIRVFSAALIYLSQVLLARWMGRSEFGVYVYVWTWLILLGGLAPLGLAYSAQRFIPEYAGDPARLRGFLVGSRALSFVLGAIVAAAGFAVVLGLGETVDARYRVPLLLALACLPVFALSSAQDSIARSYNWFGVAFLPAYIGLPILTLALVGAAYLAGVPVNATTAAAAGAAAIWTVVLLQGVILRRRLHTQVPSGSRQYEPNRWFRIALPIFLVDGFYFLLTYTDVLVLQLFVDSGEVAVYYAATKTLALIAFIYFAVSAAFAHRFSEAHLAGDREKLASLVGDAVRWTFWPSVVIALALLAVGKAILALFGEGFANGYPLLFVLVVGLLARASVGPAERLLNMVGEQRICAVAYATAFASNLVLCLLLIPPFGPMGAAVAVATALVIESVLLFVIVKLRLGLRVCFWR